jgi:acetyl-CoA carboxylase carboxyltransferase component
MQHVILEILARRYYRIRDVRDIAAIDVDGHPCTCFRYDHEGRRIRVVMTWAPSAAVDRVLGALRPVLEAPAGEDVALDFFVWQSEVLGDAEENARASLARLNGLSWPASFQYLALNLAGPDVGPGVGAIQHFAFKATEHGFAEDRLYRGAHPMMGERLHLWRLSNFHVERLPSVEGVYLLHGVAKDDSRDERLFVVAEVRDLTPVRDEQGRIVRLPQLEQMFLEAVASLRRVQAQRPLDKRLYWNRMVLYVWPPFELPPADLEALIARLASASAGVGLERIYIRARIPDPVTGALSERAIALSEGPNGLVASLGPLSDEPIRPLSPYNRKVVRSRQLGLVYPYELVRMLTAGTGRGLLSGGQFEEYDLDDHLHLAPVTREPGGNTANIVVGLVTNRSQKYPEGIRRVILLGDPTLELGSLAEPECRRIVAAIDLAEQKRLPLEWFALSAGAKIAMDSGTENMDWIALVLRQLVAFTQKGGEVNVVVNGINVGAQPYWNAEATMLMHTRGILVMMPESAMVLTGKRALDYSGGVSAEDNVGIGGFERVMGPNGQAQYFARDIQEAIAILLAHYDHTYVASGELLPRRAVTVDPVDRDVCLSRYNHDHHGFATVGDIFSEERNPARKRPFDIRQVMGAVIDQDRAPLERWTAWRDAEMTVVWDCHLGGWPVELVGLESQPLPRFGPVPADGPDEWSAGTLFPESSRKMARAINAASGNRPVVVLANLTGFDGSPESLRRWQLEYGAEIGRAVVNFRGPLIFCVISRYHGGAFVVFSNALNAHLEVAAVEGSYASVIGGAPAAAVVFQREVERRTAADLAVRELEEALGRADGAERPRLRLRLLETRQEVRAARISELASEFDRVHSIQRAQRVGSVHRIIAPWELRSYLVEAVERGIGRQQEHVLTKVARPLATDARLTTFS